MKSPFCCRLPDLPPHRQFANGWWLSSCLDEYSLEHNDFFMQLQERIIPDFTNVIAITTTVRSRPERHSGVFALAKLSPGPPPCVLKYQDFLIFLSVVTLLQNMEQHLHFPMLDLQAQTLHQH